MKKTRGGVYKGVDGRVYKLEEMPAAPDKRRFTEIQIRDFQARDEMSMIEIYRMEMFLQGQKTPRDCVCAARKERDRIVREYSLELTKGSRYVGDPEYVWSVLRVKFPKASAAYKNYKSCQYALKYGAVTPCDWTCAD